MKKLEADLKKQPLTERIMLSFIGDVYCQTQDQSETTTNALKLLVEYHAPVASLTKGGERCLKDLSLFQKFGKHIQVGATLTFGDKDKSLEWKSGAAPPIERLETLKTLKDSGITTFTSFEPVIDPSESLKVLAKSLEMEWIDIYKIGKLNNYLGLYKKDWADFLQECLALVRSSKKRV